MEILLIDDDQDELEVFKEALRSSDKGVRCTLATNLHGALEYLRHTTPHYIFIDFNMPKANGLQCLAELKKLGNLEKTRVILYSNYVSEEMNQQATTLGAYMCIKKPSMIHVLSQKLKEIFAS